MPILALEDPYIYRGQLYLLKVVIGNVVTLQRMTKDGEIINADACELIPTTLDQIAMWCSSRDGSKVGPGVEITDEEADLWNQHIVEKNDGKAIKNYF